jgi:hypothetical protein
MRNILKALIAGAIVFGSIAPALAQDDGSGEIVVTGFRKLNPDDDEDSAREARPVLPSAALTMRRTADIAVQQVTVTGDTREEGRRRDEVYTMVRNAIELASKHGVQLATGELVIEPLTLANYKNLPLTADENLADAEQVVFIVKTPLSPGVDAKTALDRISKFIAAVPAVGRAELKAQSELTLSVVNPEQYRRPIIALIARDAAETIAPFGGGYGVDVTGLDRPVQWTRASLTDVLLYLPAAYTVRPRN